MGQQEIYLFLKKNKKKKYTIRQLSEMFNLCNSSTSVNIKKLLERKEIKKSEIKNSKGGLALPFYQYKK